MPVALSGIGRSLAREGHYSEALETLRRFKAVNGFEPPIITAEIGYSEASSGDRRAALATVARLQQESAASYVDPYLIAVIYLGLGNDLIVKPQAGVVAVLEPTGGAGQSNARPDIWARIAWSSE